MVKNIQALVYECSLNSSQNWKEGEPRTLAGLCFTGTGQY
jgi:hypothetical protein